VSNLFAVSSGSRGEGSWQAVRSPLPHSSFGVAFLVLAIIFGARTGSVGGSRVLPFLALALVVNESVHEDYGV